MFEHVHHQRIATLLRAFDRNLLERADCYFGGGTAIVLALGEYRKSVDVDFMCASAEGYRLLRNTVREDSLGALLTRPVPHRRDVRASPYSVSTFLDVDGAPVKVEFVREARIMISGELDAGLGVPVLSRLDLYAEKLLANADRGSDRGVWSRDIIDLAMMIEHWGEIPKGPGTRRKKPMAIMSCGPMSVHVNVSATGAIWPIAFGPCTWTAIWLIGYRMCWGFRERLLQSQANLIIGVRVADDVSLRKKANRHQHMLTSMIPISVSICKYIWVCIWICKSMGMQCDKSISFLAGCGSSTVPPKMFCEAGQPW